MNKTCFILFLFLSLLSCNEHKEYGNTDLVFNHKLIDFSKVINSPEEYYKDTLRIKGQISMSSHNVSITDGNSWIWIESFEPALDYDYVYDNLNLHQVEIIGIYDFRKKGFMDDYIGKFTKLLYVKVK